VNKTIDEYNQFFQEYLANYLLKNKLDRRNIRPTRQKKFNPLEIPNPDYNPLIDISSNNKQFLSLSTDDNLVLFFMKQDNDATIPEIDNENNVSFVGTWEVNFAIYGKDCIDISRTIKEFQQLSNAMNFLNNNNFALGDFDSKIEIADMVINGQWYSIRKYTCTYNELVSMTNSNLKTKNIENINNININKGD